MRKKKRPVYSTHPDFSKRCKRCGYYPCRCLPVISRPPEEQVARIRREKKGRAGKTVTVVRGLQLMAADLQNLGKDLRRSCGSGGTVKDGNIEVQGDHRDRIAARLQELGYKTKFDGG